MMGLDKPQPHAKFEVAGFIQYGNIKSFVFKIEINQNGEPVIFLREIDFTIGFIDPTFPIQRSFCGAMTARKLAIFMKTRLHFGGWKVEVDNFGPKYPKAHLYA